MGDKFEDDMLLRMKNARRQPDTNFDESKAGHIAAYEQALEAYRYYKDMGLI